MSLGSWKFGQSTLEKLNDLETNKGRMFMNAQKGVHETCIQQIFINESLVVVSVDTIIMECYTSNTFQFLFKLFFVNFPLKIAKKGIHFYSKCETHVGVVFVKHFPISKSYIEIFQVVWGMKGL
jgi:hypothetical protein